MEAEQAEKDKSVELIEEGLESSSLVLADKPREEDEQTDVRNLQDPPWRTSGLIENDLSREAGLDERYDVLSRVGEGGMGSVYKVMDKVLNKVFAVKVLRSELAKDKNVATRFKQEVLAASRLTHVNLASVYSSGESRNGAPFLVMDYLEGSSLEQILAKDGHLEPSKAINVFIEICEALEHAHSKGVIHRDLKPGNILLVDEDERVKIVDFGIAKILPRAGVDTLKLTSDEEVLGSPIYMSPEQCKGDKLDVRSDIYSLGCLMYETLCGVPPFLGENPIKTILMHLNEKPSNLTLHLKEADLPTGLEYVILKCLQKVPQDRYQSVFDLRMDLIGVKENRPPRQRPLNHRMRWVAPAGTALLVSVVFLFGFEVVSSYMHPEGENRPLSFPGLSGIFNFSSKPDVVAINAQDALMREEYNNKVDAAVRAYPRNDKVLAEAEFDLTVYLIRKGDFANAELACRRVMDVLASMQDDPVLMARYQFTMGFILEREQRFPDAIKYYQNALSSIAEAFGDDSPILGLAHNRLAISYERNRYFTEAEEDYKIALEIFKKRFGVKSSEVNSVMNNLAGFYKHRRISEQEQSYRDQLNKNPLLTVRWFRVDSRDNPAYMSLAYSQNYTGKLDGER
ncbi:MAG: serine/threonine protein kinase [Cyanobacteria bacterium TGS_CYA1]|nr:serine/threonine protein kinase [Cyanobacteria bacterium TGS_CYA1]